MAILFALLKMMTEEHYQRYLSSFGSKKDLRVGIDFKEVSSFTVSNILITHEEIGSMSKCRRHYCLVLLVN